MPGTLSELLRERAQRSPSSPAHWACSGGGRWRCSTWAQVADRVAAAARGLRSLGLSPGERVAIVAPSDSSWDEIHMAVLAARGVVAGIDPHAGPAQTAALAALIQPVGLVVADPQVLQHLDEAATAKLRFAVTLSLSRSVDAPSGLAVQDLDALVAQGVAAEGPWDDAQPDDPAWVIFTSGTTGQPRGLIYRHRQVGAAVDAILDAFDDIAEGARLVSWLPLSNPFQRIINLCAVARGAQIYYVSDPREVMMHLPAIRPQVFIGVPRFFEKLDQGLTQRLEGGGAVKARLARWALAVGDRHAALQRAGRPVPAPLRLAHRLADALVLRRIRAAFGGELRYFVSGSAAMPQWLLERLHAMGLLVLEAYGLSECIVPVAANRPGAWRFGTVGRPMAGNRVRLADDGELLLKSDGVFEGYLGAEDETGAVDADGWLATGDFAEIDDDGFVRLVGRKSEVFKTSTGRRVAPAVVEGALRAAPGVEHAAVYGAGRKCLLAVVNVAADAPAPAPALAERAREAMADLPDYLRPAGLIVTAQPFGIESGELTGNLKLRRHRVGERYAAALDALGAAIDEGREPPTELQLEAGPVRLVVL